MRDCSAGRQAANVDYTFLGHVGFLPVLPASPPQAGSALSNGYPDIATTPGCRQIRLEAGGQAASTILHRSAARSRGAGTVFPRVVGSRSELPLVPLSSLCFAESPATTRSRVPAPNNFGLLLAASPDSAAWRTVSALGRPQWAAGSYRSLRDCSVGWQAANSDFGHPARLPSSMPCFELHNSGLHPTDGPWGFL